MMERKEMLGKAARTVAQAHEDWNAGGGWSVAWRRTAFNAVGGTGLIGIGAGEGYGFSKLSESMGVNSSGVVKLFAATGAIIGVGTAITEGMSYPLRAGRALRRGLEPPPIIYPIRVPFSPHQALRR